MAGTVVWTGNALAVAQVAKGSIDSVDGTPANNEFFVTIGGAVVSQVGDTDVATTAIALLAKLVAETDARFARITWTNPSAGNIWGTARSAGVPFVAVLTETGAGTGSVTDFSDDPASSGPNDASVAGNWDTGAVPGAGDDAVLENSSVSILYGLGLPVATMASFTRRKSYTGLIGLPRTNPGGYVEYLSTYLGLDATVATIDASGSGRTKLNFRAVQNACVINGSGSRAESAVPSVLLLGTHVANTLVVNKGDVGVNWFSEEALDSKLASVNIGFINNQASDSTVVFGAMMSQLTTVNINGGNTKILANAGTVNYTTGVAELGDTATVTTLNVLTGTFLYKSSGTATTINVYANATVDFSRDSRSRIVTNANVNLAENGSVNDPLYTVTWTNDITPTAL